ncbi:PA2779 family protein [Parahaliea sp. F7430]|uniref:PA2779 family protein n=1 Tax=Sediminihaliea albiluteola TaxID=2758564 RepID=A0A7W2TWH0_9GAMM|nr:PA2779 family protein [Sediminihaliea albiluteola]MBA6413232.1 PA2779 family protein [Sediminihaliea albiluteola]
MYTARAIMLFKALILICATTFSTAQAAVISTSEYIVNETQSSHLSNVERLLARDDVQQQLVAMGVSPEEALARVAALSPSELQLLSQRAQEMPAGSGVLGLIGAVFVVLLVLELVGVTNVFNSI